MVRVLQLIASLKIGGAQQLQVTLAEQAPAAALTLTVASLHADPDSPYRSALTRLGIPVIEFPAPRLLDGQRLRRLITFVRQERFDLIHTHLTYANILGVITGQLTRTPVIGTLHNVRVEPRHYHPLREGWLEPALLRHGARRVVAVGRQVAEAYRPTVGTRHMVVIPNAVGANRPLAAADCQALRQTITGDAARPLVLAVGRLTEQKGYPDLITAFAQVRASHPAACLAIAGGGKLYSHLAQILDQTGLTGSVRLLGPRTDVPQLLQACDLYVSAALWEGLPVAVLEAMAAGRAVIATGVGDVPEVLADEAGWVVPPAAPAELARAMTQLLADPAHRVALGQNALARVQQDYSPAVWFQRYLQLYADVLHEDQL